MSHQQSSCTGTVAHRGAAAGAHRRAAMTLIETAVAAAMLAVFMITATRMMATLSAQRQASERHALALQTADNLLEELSSQSWHDLTPEAAADWATGAALKLERLPGAKLTAEVVDETEPVVAKRLSVSLAWKTPAGRPGAPIRLTAWVFPRAQAEPSAEIKPAPGESTVDAEPPAQSETSEP